MNRSIWGKALLTAALLCTGAAQAQVLAGHDRFGDVMRVGLPVAAAALSVYRDDMEGVKELAYSAVASQVATEVLKRAVDSRRPDGTGRGFPSGHASLTFASATYVHLRYGVQTAWPFYALAGLTAANRVNSHNHYTKDVVAGALIGSGSAWLFTHRLGERTSAMLLPVQGGAWVQVSSRW